jgi:hypothetical protein
MKNPMDRQLEKRLSDRAVAIGREGNAAAFGELLELLRSSSANARRLAASALGKLAWMGVDQASAVAALAPAACRDPHPQTRQYAIKALKAYGAAAQGTLQDLRDMGCNPAEREYIRRDAAPRRPSSKKQSVSPRQPQSTAASGAMRGSRRTNTPARTRHFSASFVIVVLTRSSSNGANSRRKLKSTRRSKRGTAP